MLRARLDNAQGQHGNQVIWFNAGKTANEALDAMDGWLAAVEADKGSQGVAAKIVNDRPAALTDLCGAADGTKLTMQQCTGVPDGTTRMAAGAPLADDVLDCRLVPLGRSTYAATFTDDQWSQLQAAFPTGVCDYGQKGNGQQPTSAWMSYLNADGTVMYGGSPLPALP